MWPIASCVLKVHQAVNGGEVPMNSRETLSLRIKVGFVGPLAAVCAPKVIWESGILRSLQIRRYL